jgi:hypothetical protein
LLRGLWVRWRTVNTLSGGTLANPLTVHNVVSAAAAALAKDTLASYVAHLTPDGGG